jgi:YspA, cpYpsA-related SLOG family
VRLLVCGGRNYMDTAFAFATLYAIHLETPIVLLIHGDCPTGTDQIADQWALERRISIDRYRVNHALDGQWPGAGPRRNARMLRESKPGAVLAFPGGRGTADMCRRARAAGVPVWEAETV